LRSLAPGLELAPKVQDAVGRQLCANGDGTIAAVMTFQGIPGADAAITATVRRWRHWLAPRGLVAHGSRRMSSRAFS
jgi:hypothetical protein